MSRASVRFSLVSRRDLVRGAAALGAVVALPDCAGDKPGGDTASGGPLSDGPVTIDPITPNDSFYVTSCCGTPEVDITTWTLTIADRGTPLMTWTMDTLDMLTPRDKEHTLECIGGGPYSQAIGNAVWTGLPLQEIFDGMGIQVPEGTVELKFTSDDGYTTSLPIADLAKPVWLVWLMNGDPLPARHGYPARLLVPGRYGMKNPKWIVAIEFIDQPYTGFWENQGWSNTAEYKPNTLIRDPKDGYTVPAGEYRIVGTAFAGSDPITLVEISFDGGVTWTDAAVDYSPGADVWTLWHYDWVATPGVFDVQVRCTTEGGAMSNPDPAGTGGLAGYDGSMLVTVYVD